MSHFLTSKQHPTNRQIIVWVIIGLSCLPFYLLKNHGLGAISQLFMPSSLTELLVPFSIWRLWTPTFVHYTYLHLFTNLYLWWLFASKIEGTSRTQLVVVMVISAACANYCQWLYTGEDFGGLSGVVYALLSYTWIIDRYGANDGYHVDPSLGIVMLLVIPLSATGIFGKFANAAHLGGLISGALLALAYLTVSKQTNISKS